MVEETDRTQGFAHALKALADGAEAAAAEIAEGMLRRWPNDAGVHQLMAAVALRAQKPADAELWALSALALRPDHFATLMLGAQAARALGKWREAHDRFQRAFELEPQRREAAFGAAVATIRIDASQSPNVFENLLRSFPDPSSNWADVGGALERGGQSELAVRAFELAIAAQPTATLFLRLGSALQALGRRAEAAVAYQKALHVDPGLAEAWFKLGLAFQDSGRTQAAEEAYRRALALRPHLPEAEVNLGVVLQELGDLAGAKQAYGRAIALMPSAFGRVAQALSTSPKGELWMDLGKLRDHLSELGRLFR
jgi:tetratricopeptide (TPR) repeat protein